jgi:anaerobic magnesium-protoporphyrin IX monomethyl ester cyclase
VSVSYPLPGTRFYEMVKEDLKSKSNWTDSDDLALMYQGTYSPQFYKQLHRYIHKRFRREQGVQSVKKFFAQPFSLDRIQWRRMIMLPYFIPMSWWSKRRLRMQ